MPLDLYKILKHLDIDLIFNLSHVLFKFLEIARGSNTKYNATYPLCDDVFIVLLRTHVK